MDPAALPSLDAWRAGNAGVRGVWSFAAAADGPHVMVNALTHGNEPCGAVAVSRLLAAGLRPRRGRLTLSFANLDAWEAFCGGARPGRYLDRDLNRLWRDDWIDADAESREAHRARELRPLLGTVDVLLDLHSTAHVPRPFFVIADLPKTRALAGRIGWPPAQQLMPGGCGEGRHLTDYARFGDPDDPATAVTIECGRHDDREAGDNATIAAVRFLEAVEAIEPGAVPDFAAPTPAPVERYRTAGPYVVATDRYRFLGAQSGFHRAEEGDIVAIDGAEEVRAPFDTTIISPRPAPRRGEVAFLWSVRVD